MNRPIGTNYFRTENPPEAINNTDQIDHINNNKKRTEVYALPLGLEKGEVLPNKWMVTEEVVVTNEGARVVFKDDTIRYVPLRLPLKLGRMASPETLPQDLRRGDILYTGDVVLDDPEEAHRVFADSDQRTIMFSLSGGQRPQQTSSPNDLYLARFGTLDDLDQAPEIFVKTVANKLAYLRKSLLAKAMGDFPIIEELMADKRTG